MHGFIVLNVFRVLDVRWVLERHYINSYYDEHV